MLMSHEPVDLLVVMLGTNDTKERLGANAFAIGLGMRRLIQKAKTVDCWEPEGKPNILVVAPPAMGDGVYTSYAAQEMGKGSVEKSRQVPAEYRTVCENEGVHFLDANELGDLFNKVDYMHLTRAGHARFAQALAELIPTIV